jgi:hypothetical protein
MYDDDFGGHVSVVRCKMVDATPVVKGRSCEGGPYTVFAPTDYVAVTCEELLTIEQDMLATTLHSLDVYHLLPKKSLHLGYEPLADSRIGHMQEAYDTSGVTAGGKPTKVKQVLYTCLLLSVILVLTLLCTLRCS